jgi:hypothetical protein
MRIRIQIQDFDDHKLKKIYSLKFVFFSQKLQFDFDDHKLKKIYSLKFVFFFPKIAICLSLGLYKGCPSYRRSLYPSKENIQHFKAMKLLNFFPDPDPPS